MNIYQNTQLGGLIHKLSKYQTLLARAPSHKANIYESKVNSYKNQLSQIGYGMNQEGGAFTLNPDGATFSDGKGNDNITVNQVITAIQTQNTEFQKGANEVGEKYNNLIAQLTTIFQKLADLEQKLKESEQQNKENNKKIEKLEKSKGEILENLRKLKGLKDDLAAKIAANEAAIKKAQEELEEAKRNNDQDAQKRLEKSLEDLQKEREYYESELKKLNGIIADKEQQISRLENELAEEKERANQCCAERDALKAELSKYQGQVGTLTTNIETLANISIPTFTPPILNPITNIQGLSPEMQKILDTINAQASK
jgi:uncharacterized coiled-coil DUF342 family protein